MKIAIIGAGIGGLTTAIALQQKGFEVNIFERSTQILPVGAGIVLAANAIKGLKILGLYEEIRQKGHIVSAFNIVDTQLNTLSQVYAEKFFQRYGLGNLTIARYDLHHILASHLQPNTLTLNKKLIDFTQNAAECSLTFADGTTQIVDAIIATDGINSHIRQKLLPDSQKRYAGYTCWRAITEVGTINCDFTKAFECWGAKGRFGFVPIANNRVYWFLCMNTAQNNQTLNEVTTADLQEMLKEYAFPIPQILGATENNKVINNDIIDLKPIKQFAFDKILLAGDAAHATTPNMGQGACQAIEDALILRKLINHHEPIEQVFKAFEKNRIPRTSTIVNRSWYIGKLAQLENPFFIKIRNWMLSHAPENSNNSQLKFLYEVDF
jgi:2-polyprenyl-6-methoxyphenol hydroxylase-like FAD-dependent oxidoreductase